MADRIRRHLLACPGPPCTCHDQETPMPTTGAHGVLPDHRGPLSLLVDPGAHMLILSLVELDEHGAGAVYRGSDGSAGWQLCIPWPDWQGEPDAFPRRIRVIVDSGQARP